MVPGGFATVLVLELRVVDGRVVGDGGVVVPIDGHTALAIGAELGVTAGPAEGAYDDGAGVDLDETLTLDPDQADVIMGGLGRGHDALVALAPAETPVLWPEHFDVAIRVQDINFGVSPGDGFIEEPYAYVGVARPPACDVFWSASFGAAVPLKRAARCRRCHRLLRRGPPAQRVARSAERPARPRQRRADARAAPSTSAPSFAQPSSGWIREPNPQSPPRR